MGKSFVHDVYPTPDIRLPSDLVGWETQPRDDTLDDGQEFALRRVMRFKEPELKASGQGETGHRPPFLHSKEFIRVSPLFIECFERRPQPWRSGGPQKHARNHQRLPSLRPSQVEQFFHSTGRPVVQIRARAKRKPDWQERPLPRYGTLTQSQVCVVGWADQVVGVPRRFPRIRVDDYAWFPAVRGEDDDTVSQMTVVEERVGKNISIAKPGKPDGCLPSGDLDLEPETFCRPLGQVGDFRVPLGANPQFGDVSILMSPANRRHGE